MAHCIARCVWHRCRCRAHQPPAGVVGGAVIRLELAEDLQSIQDAISRRLHLIEARSIKRPACHPFGTAIRVKANSAAHEQTRTHREERHSVCVWSVCVCACARACTRVCVSPRHQTRRSGQRARISRARAVSGSAATNRSHAGAGRGGLEGRGGAPHRPLAQRRLPVQRGGVFVHQRAQRVGRRAPGDPVCAGKRPQQACALARASGAAAAARRQRRDNGRGADDGAQLACQRARAAHLRGGVDRTYLLFAVCVVCAKRQAVMSRAV